MTKHKRSLKKQYEDLLRFEFFSRKTSPIAVIISIIFHLAIAITVIILFSIDKSKERTPSVHIRQDQKPIVQASVVSAKVVDNEVKRLDKIQSDERRAEIRKKQLQEKKYKQQLAAKKAKLEQQKKNEQQANIEKQKKEQALEKKRLESLKSLGLAGINQQITEAENAQKQAQIRAENQRKLLTEADRYKALIKQVIQSNWIDPESLAQNNEVWLKIRLDIEGKVQSVSVYKSSGNSVFDRQALMAVKKAQQLPMPQSEKLKKQFQNITMSFGGNN
ncbi:cell envelope integrity protein TolA [Thiotrichales bacterium 19S11-10]|nr:cell envelope integrity protein TolA [Thiotrichales bacterium 19S11-10]